jgi:hypothetical protein
MPPSSSYGLLGEGIGLHGRLALSQHHYVAPRSSLSLHKVLLRQWNPLGLLMGVKTLVHLIRSFGFASYLPYKGEAPSRAVDSGCMSPVSGETPGPEDGSVEGEGGHDREL